jgi:hypothetical protein
VAKAKLGNDKTQKKRANLITDHLRVEKPRLDGLLGAGPTSAGFGEGQGQIVHQLGT